MWKPVLDHGHVFGIHGHSHRLLTELSFEEQLCEIRESKVLLESSTGAPVKWFRPPYGLYNEDTMRVVKTLDLEMVLWHIASWDWKHSKDEECILENVFDHIGPGDIVLLHELPQTLRILPTLIRGIRNKGLNFSLPQTILSMK